MTEDLRVELVAEDRVMDYSGSVTYRVYLDRKWIGWVGDGRPWRGWRWGTLKWWACHREDGDTGARWSTDLDYSTRKAALAALLSVISDG